MRVIARIYGGLGNQLFMYAFARRLALAHDAELVLDISSGFTRDPFRRDYALQHFHVPGRPATDWESYSDSSGIPRRRAARLANRFLPLASRWYLHEQSQSYDPIILEPSRRRSLYLEGYWQQAEHTEAIADVLRRDLRFSWQPGAALRRLGALLRDSPSVCVHVRQFGLPAEASEARQQELPFSYYERAIAAVRHHIGVADFYVFTEKPECPVVAHLLAAGCRLAGNGVPSGSAITDFWLMTHCRHFIVANSTFSWWAAWLGGEEASLVVAPSRNRDILNLEFSTPIRWLSLPPCSMGSSDGLR